MTAPGSAELERLAAAINVAAHLGYQVRYELTPLPDTEVWDDGPMTADSTAELEQILTDIVTRRRGPLG